MVINREEILKIRIRRFPGTTLVLILQSPKRKLVPFIARARRERIRDTGFRKEDFENLIIEVDRLRQKI
jgi:hypothetical protein